MNYLERLSADIESMGAEAIGQFLHDETGFTAVSINEQPESSKTILINYIFSSCIGEVKLGIPVDKAKLKQAIDGYLRDSMKVWGTNSTPQ